MLTSKKILWIADRWDTLDHARDSTLHLASFAQEKLGIPSYWTLPEHLFLENGMLYAQVTGPLTLNADPALRLPASEKTILPLKNFSSIHWRSDPPVTIDTFRLWSLLVLFFPKADAKQFVNNPHGLLFWSEKFSSQRYPSWTIPSLIADDPVYWEHFLKSRTGKKVVAKPAGEAASRGVQILPLETSAALQTINSMRKEFGGWIVLQEFEQEILTSGETRVFIIDGKIAGALNKKPNDAAPIMNLDLPVEQHPVLKIVTPTATQAERATKIAQDLKQDGIHLASIDFIGERILEINVTSVGLLKWFDEQNQNLNLAEKYWANL